MTPPTDDLEKRLMTARQRFVSFDELDALCREAAEALRLSRREALEEAARVAECVRLPDGYQYGRDALENFQFGKNRAADAIRALLSKETGV